MTWQRLESATVAPDLYEGQEARIADPLWMLGRQWQVGEFKGEDAASPVLAEATIEYAPLTRVRPGAPEDGGPVIERSVHAGPAPGRGPAAVPLAEAGLPLETGVEREPVRTGPAAVRLAAEAGLQLLRALDGAGAPPALAAKLRAAFPLRLPPDDGLDPVGRAQLELLARRACDARALYAQLSRGTAILGGSSPVLDAWATWYGKLFSEPAGAVRAWNPQRMEYRFQIAAGVSAQSEVQLDATEYAGGRLDWHTFDRARKPRDMGARGTLKAHDLRVLPTTARFAGQAASRWWRMESGSIWFGDLQAAPTDLARAAVATYGMLAGDDWFMVPGRLPVGVIARAAPVRVIDTFGDTHRIRSCAELDGPGRTWRFFELAGDASADAAALTDRTCPWLLLPPVLPTVTESPPVEEVALLRDETANLGWAAELRVESAAGRAIDRAARARAAMSPPPAPAPDAWLYRLGTAVPEHLVPLVPVQDGDAALYLQRGRLATAADPDGVQTAGAIGRILEPGHPLLIHDDEVPATGARVTRSWQVARTADGGVVVWVGRRKRAGRPLRSPGLVFDQVVQAADSPDIDAARRI